MEENLSGKKRKKASRRREGLRSMLFMEGKKDQGMDGVGGVWGGGCGGGWGQANPKGRVG